jgi:hypothetical protein
MKENEADKVVTLRGHTKKGDAVIISNGMVPHLKGKQRVKGTYCGTIP